jgi:DNA modification methylase
MMQRLILALSDPNELIVDCFVGSGTTAIVANSIGRRYACCDSDAGFVTTAKAALSNNEGINKKKAA